MFPGVGLGAIVSETSRITDEMFLAAADTLAREVTEADLREGRIYPAVGKIRAVSARIAAAVAEVAHARGLARVPRPADILADIRSRMFEPTYPVYDDSPGREPGGRTRQAPENGRSRRKPIAC